MRGARFTMTTAKFTMATARITMAGAGKFLWLILSGLGFGAKPFAAVARKIGNL